MIVVVSNLWPREKFYERSDEIAKRMMSYADDPVIRKYSEIYPLDKYLDAGASTDSISDEFGALSNKDRSETVIRQFVFFTMFLRALILSQKDRVSTVVAYCSGIVPVLNAVAAPHSSEGFVDLSPKLLSELNSQDGMVAENATKKDVVMSIIGFHAASATLTQMSCLIEKLGDGAAFVTDVKSDKVVVVSGVRANVKSIIRELKSLFGEDAIEVSRLVTHGGLHTPLAAPDGCWETDDDPSWRRLYDALAQSPINILTSTGDEFDRVQGANGLEKIVRSTFFDTVQSGRMTQKIKAMKQPVRYVGLPSVLLDMFIGTGLRPKQSEIAGPQHI